MALRHGCGCRSPPPLRYWAASIRAFQVSMRQFDGTDSKLIIPSNWQPRRRPRGLLQFVALRRANVAKCQRAQLFTVKINKTQTTPMRNQACRQRIVAERAATEMRRQAADIGERVDFDAQ